MNVEHEQKSAFSFGAFRLEPSERRLWREDEPIALKPKQFDLLSYFVENAGRTVKKSEILEAVWPDAYVDESTLARNVSWLRVVLDDGASGSKFIETVPKLGYRFTAETAASAKPEAEANVLIIEEQKVQYFRKEETVTLHDTDTKTVNRWNSFRKFAPAAIAVVVLIGAAFALYPGFVESDERVAASDKKDAAAVFPPQSADVPNKGLRGGTAPAATANSQVKIGSAVHLRNQLSEDAGYLDAWGLVKSKPEFADVVSELMFVATHPNPDRQTGSGSWEIVSATGKRDGEPLKYGDRVHLRNLQPDAGYLDNCGWVKDLRVFRDFNKFEKFAVFTTDSENRDAGTGTWIVGSDDKFEGDQVMLDDYIFLENGFAGGGYLNAAGRVSDVSAFSDYDGSRLVFIHSSSAGRHPQSGIWAISDAHPGAK